MPDFRTPGGAVVRRRFRCGERVLLAGATLSAEEIRQMRPVNRKALAEGGFIDVFPAPPGVRHVINLTGGKYDVIEGVKLNPEPLTREAAIKLAHTPAGSALPG